MVFKFISPKRSQTKAWWSVIIRRPYEHLSNDERWKTFNDSWKSSHTIASSAYALECACVWHIKRISFGQCQIQRLLLISSTQGSLCIHTNVCVRLANKHHSSIHMWIRMGGVTHSMDRFILARWFSIKYPFYEWLKRWRTYRNTFSFVMVSSMGLSTRCAHETACVCRWRRWWKEWNKMKTKPNTRSIYLVDVQMFIPPAFLRMHVGIPQYHVFYARGSSVYWKQCSNR